MKTLAIASLVLATLALNGCSAVDWWRPEFDATFNDSLRAYENQPPASREYPTSSDYRTRGGII